MATLLYFYGLSHIINFILPPTKHFYQNQILATNHAVFLVTFPDIRANLDTVI